MQTSEPFCLFSIFTGPSSALPPLALVSLIVPTLASQRPPVPLLQPAFLPTHGNTACGKSSLSLPPVKSKTNWQTKWDRERGLLQPSAFLFAPRVSLLSEGDVLGTAVNRPPFLLPKPEVLWGSLLPPRAQQGAAGMAPGMAALWARAQAKLRDGREDSTALQAGRTGSSEGKLWVWCSPETRASSVAQPQVLLLMEKVAMLQRFCE